MKNDRTGSTSTPAKATRPAAPVQKGSPGPGGDRAPAGPAPAVRRQRICIDFDGVIHVYPKDWRERVDFGQSTLQEVEVPGAMAALRELRKTYDLVICTARQGNLKSVREWMKRHAPDLADIEVTNRKPGSALYIDDNAMRFEMWDQMTMKFIRERMEGSR